MLPFVLDQQLHLPNPHYTHQCHLIYLNLVAMSHLLKDQNKEKKFKPIKVPTKAQIVAAHPPVAHRKEESEHSSKVTENKENKLKLKSSIGTDDKKIKSMESISSELLKEGFIQSFIDMFYISHKCLPNVMSNANYIGEVIASSEESDLNQADHAFLGDLAVNLKKAEAFSYYNQPDKEAAMNEYNSLAYTYEDQGDFVTSAYFYNRVVELARAYKHKQFEVVAMIGLGKCFDQEHRTDEAIDILEGSLGVAEEIDNEAERANMIKTISKDLIDIYLKVAEEHEKEEATVPTALVYFEKCLAVARKAQQHESEGRICYKIGQLYYRIEEYKKSVNYQQKYLEIIKEHLEQSRKSAEEGKQKMETLMKTKTMEAHASLAKCYLKMKEVELAEDHLNHYNQLAKQLKIQNAQADSSYYLAKLYEQKGSNHKAIEFYKAYFEAAKSQRPEKKNRALVDKARVTYAIAKANENMERFIQIFQGENSLKQVLDWKIKKELK